MAGVVAGKAFTGLTGMVVAKVSNRMSNCMD